MDYGVKQEDNLNVTRLITVGRSLQPRPAEMLNMVCMYVCVCVCVCARAHVCVCSCVFSPGPLACKMSADEGELSPALYFLSSHSLSPLLYSSVLSLSLL